MKDFPHASLIYLTEPEPGKPVLNILVESNTEPVRVWVNPDQLAKMLFDGNRIQFGYIEERA